MQVNEEFAASAARINEIVDAIPGEGGLEMDIPSRNGKSGTHYKYTPDTLQPLSMKPFEGKVPALPSDKTMKITIGAPGSGKSQRVKKRFQLLPEHVKRTTAGISYDEDIAGNDGAIFNTPNYVETLRQIEPAYRDQHIPVPVASFDMRAKLWKGVQKVTQYIRGGSLKHGLREGFSLLIDTTSSSKGTQFLIKAGRDLNYKKIEMEGCFAPFPISRERIEARARPTSLVEDLVGKRIGVMEWLEKHAEKVDSFRFEYNPTNDAEPRLMFHIQNGQVRDIDKVLVGHMIEDIETDRYIVKAFLDEMKDTRPEYNEIKVEEYMDRYDEAASTLKSFLRGLKLGEPAFNRQVAVSGPMASNT